MSTITTRAFWRAAASRAAYTALAAAVPLVAYVATGEQTLDYAASVTALAALASLATSLVRLPELDDHRAVPFWRAVLSRCARTAGQVAVPVLAAAVTLGDVDPTALATQIGGAVAVTLIRTLMAYLPETGEGPREEGS